MTHEHTPGPWQVSRGRHDGSFLVEPVTSPRQTVAICAAGTVRPDGSGEANARLIAAAPDLLAACEEIAANTDHVEEGRGIVWKLQEIARAAIALARPDKP